MVMWQHNVWCVFVAFCVERYFVEFICGNGAAYRLVCVCVERYVVEVICGNVAS